MATQSSSYAERNRAADTASTEPNWVSPAECIAIHDLLLVRYGGIPGLRDDTALGAALEAPKSCFRAGYRSLAKLAIVYIQAFTEKKPFLSGNLAIAFLIGITFLRVNGRVLSGEEVAAAETTSNLVAGACPERFYWQWLYANTSE